MYPFHTLIKKQIAVDFFPPSRRQKTDKVIIFCPGAPSLPGKSSTIRHYADLGYWGISMRYRGTWESTGQFLRKSPHLDVKDIIDELPKGLADVWTRTRFSIKPKEIYLVGTSFGGPAVLLNANDPRVNKVIAVSSVIDWTVDSIVEPLSEEYRIYKEGYPGAYRLSKSDWNKLKKGMFYNPITKADELDGSKILLLHCNDDDICPVGPAQTFAELTGAKIIRYKRGGHAQMSLREGYQSRQIIKFISS